jgi:hypothetical protein
MAKKSKTRSGRDRGGAVRFRRYLIALSAASVAVAVVIVLLARGGDDDGGGGPVVLPSPRPADIVQDGHLLGSADAPVTVIEYADFQ